MSAIATILTVLLGIIYWPLNKFYLWVQKHYFEMKVKDPMMYSVFTPLYWLLVAIVSLFSFIYEKIASIGAH